MQEEGKSILDVAKLDVECREKETSRKSDDYRGDNAKRCQKKSRTQLNAEGSHEDPEHGKQQDEVYEAGYDRGCRA